MRVIPTQGYDDGMLKIHAVTAEGIICLDWRGRSNGRTPVVELAPFFEKVTTEAKASGDAIEMRFDMLEELNSSTLTAIIHLIQRAKQMGLRLTLIYDARLKWQKICFQALKVFAKAGTQFELREATSPPPAP